MDMLKKALITAAGELFVGKTILFAIAVLCGVTLTVQTLFQLSQRRRRNQPLFYER